MTEFRIQFSDPSFIAAPAREATFKWASNEILVSQQDNPKLVRVDANDSLAVRHKEILEGVTSGGIHPSGIQLGVKMVSLKDFGMKSGHMTVAQTRERCRLLRNYRVGLVTFSGCAQGVPDKEQNFPHDEVAGFAAYTTALNENESERDAYAGVPFQAPHSSVRRRPSAAPTP